MLQTFPRTDSPFHRDGFVMIPGLLDEQECQAIIGETESLYDVEAPDGPRSYYRVQDAWQESPAVRALASHPRVLELLQGLYGRRPFPFQTLNFRTGTQQRNHSDSIHFSSIPSRFMCGVWVALEDTDHDNGPLFYVPGSHTLPEVTLADLGMTLDEANYARYEDGITEMLTAAGLQHEEVHVPRGTAFVWSANLIHGGMPINTEGRTRHSQVTHYFFDDCIYYTPFYSEVPTGELFVRAPIDISTGLAVPPSFNGKPVRFEHVRGNLMRVRYEDQADDAFAGFAAGLGAEAEEALNSLLRVYRVRPDLLEAFGGLDNVDVAGLLRWALSHGVNTDGAAPALRAQKAGLQKLADAISPGESSTGPRARRGLLRRPGSRG